MTRKICEIASDIRAEWRKPYFGAVPYLSAMLTLEDKDSRYGWDSAVDIVRYFLCNASTFRGGRAKELKAELKNLIK